MNLAFKDGLTTLHDFDLNTDLGDVHDQYSPIVELPNAQHHAQMLSHFIMDNFQKFHIHDIIEFEKILKRLRKMTIADHFR